LAARSTEESTSPSTPPSACVSGTRVRSREGKRGKRDRLGDGRQAPPRGQAVQRTLLHMPTPLSLSLRVCKRNNATPRQGRAAHAAAVTVFESGHAGSANRQSRAQQARRPLQHVGGSSAMRPRGPEDPPAKARLPEGHRIHVWHRRQARADVLRSALARAKRAGVKRAPHSRRPRRARRGGVMHYWPPPPLRARRHLQERCLDLRRVLARQDARNHCLLGSRRHGADCPGDDGGGASCTRSGWLPTAHSAACWTSHQPVGHHSNEVWTAHVEWLSVRAGHECSSRERGWRSPRRRRASCWPRCCC